VLRSRWAGHDVGSTKPRNRKRSRRMACRASR
jgi:hypothetical protein